MMNILSHLPKSAKLDFCIHMMNLFMKTLRTRNLLIILEEKFFQQGISPKIRKAAVRYLLTKTSARKNNNLPTFPDGFRND